MKLCGVPATVEPRYNEVPKDRTIYFVITGILYKRYPDITKLLKKYKKFRYTGFNYLFSKRPKLYNTKCRLSDGDNASESCNLHVV